MNKKRKRQSEVKPELHDSDDADEDNHNLDEPVPAAPEKDDAGMSCKSSCSEQHDAEDDVPDLPEPCSIVPCDDCLPEAQDSPSELPSEEPPPKDAMQLDHEEFDTGANCQFQEHLCPAEHDAHPVEDTPPLRDAALEEMEGPSDLGHAGEASQPEPSLPQQAAASSQPEPADTAFDGESQAAHPPPARLGPPAVPGAPRASGPKIHSSPEILKRLEPCSIFKLRLNFNDHRFTCETKAPQDPRWIDAFGQKTFSKGFKITRDWQGALKKVHEHMWEKFKLTEDTFPLQNVAEQLPGEIPADVIADLAGIINQMPEPRVYGK